jgi:hypothetical protein
MKLSISGISKTVNVLFSLEYTISTFSLCNTFLLKVNSYAVSLHANQNCHVTFCKELVIKKINKNLYGKSKLSIVVFKSKHM